MSIEIGLRGRAETVVNSTNTAAAAGSGSLTVFGTPFMVALMEKAASESFLPHLPAGDSSVGTKVNIDHVSATPMGMKVWAESEVTLVDGKRIELTVTAYDEKGLIGKGTHERFIITDERFLAKTARKLEG
ncbi:MAG: thioesterase family protein [Oscillospiraceae bacterium]|nr:thioesterase family protein [Oscillospiraceae bacterium]